MKNKTFYICEICENTEAKWMGKCSSCNSWNSLIESQDLSRSKKVRYFQKGSQPLHPSEIKEEKIKKYSTGSAEFDRVLGGGIVPAGVVLIGGEPGVGKSTLLLELCGNLEKIKSSKQVLYVSGEETEGQVYSRLKRLGLKCENLLIFKESIWERVKEQLKNIKPDVLIIDSIQTLESEEASTVVGSASLIRELSFEIVKTSKEQGISSFIVGHITKEGSIAGPKVLEHMVDTVIYFENNRSDFSRSLKTIKNRYGDANEVGFFEMTDKGLKDVKTASNLFMSNLSENRVGSVFSCVLRGSLPVVIEVQALLVDSQSGSGLRKTQGYDLNRLLMIIAIVEKYLGFELSQKDIYVNIIGDTKHKDKALDIAVIASIISSLKNKPIIKNSVLIGEIGLSGEIRPVLKRSERIKEAVKFGIKNFFVPKIVGKTVKNLVDESIIELEDLKNVLKVIS